MPCSDEVPAGLYWYGLKCRGPGCPNKWLHTLPPITPPSGPAEVLQLLLLSFQEEGSDVG